MAGIYAYSQAATQIEREELRALRDHMAARGPDGCGEWYSADGRVGLAHRRLSIIDLSNRAAQPMASADGDLVISFNGEIYNYRELRSELQAEGRVFRTESDTEVLLHLYEEHGTAMLRKLRGMFAFALWDGRRRSMLLARDCLGVKPLYYSNARGVLRLASQVKALLRAPVDTSPEPAGHAGFWLWGSVPEPWTLYRGIRSLPAGHFIVVGESGTCEPRLYGSVTDVLLESASAPASGSRADAVERIAAAVHASVRAHLVADVPVGVFLSAGLDSAMIATCARAAGQTLRTLTLGFSEYQGMPQDEAPLAQELAATLGTGHVTMMAERADFEAQQAHLLDSMDQPSIDGVNTWFVARAAAAQGMKVALSGVGGDELLASYPSFRQVPRIAKLMSPLSRVPGLGALLRRASAPAIGRITSPKYASLVEYGGSFGGAYLLRRAMFMPWELPSVMDPDAAREGWRTLCTFERLAETAPAPLHRQHPRFAVSALEMSWYMRNQLLRDSDWAGMAHSVEIRVPFADIELTRTVAPWLAAHPDITKREVASAVAAELPQLFLRRRKTGFSVPVHEWLGAADRRGRGMRGWAHAVHSWPSKRRAASIPPRVLVSTLAPTGGGVRAMTAFVVRALRQMGMTPVIAHYEPYRTSPELSVPSFALLRRSVGSRSSRAFEGCETHAIGAWLPELEFTHYFATRRWRALIEGCDAWVVASGNVLAGTSLWQTGRPYLAWVATDWEGDRKDRVKTFPALRRSLDRLVNSPVLRWFERSLLRSGRVLSLSEYTARTLKRVAGPAFETEVMPAPIDTDIFVADPRATVVGRVGFAGRFNDARKNIGLLVEAVALARVEGAQLTVLLIGDHPEAALVDRVRELGLTGVVTFESNLSRAALCSALQSLDLFVLPSRQEGLCIAALEAMACGVPVVSTRCGGPEEFVIPGKTGALVGFDAQELAQELAAIVRDRTRRNGLAVGARELAETVYSERRAMQIFERAFYSSFPQARGNREQVLGEPELAAHHVA